MEQKQGPNISIECVQKGMGKLAIENAVLSEQIEKLQFECEQLKSQLNEKRKEGVK